MTGKHSHQARAMRSTLAGGALLFLVCCVALAQAPIGAQGPAQTGRAAAFRAVSYDVYASLPPETQSLSARAIVEFESQDLSRTVECELHPNLRLTAVRDESGKVLEFDRDDRDDIGVRIVLPNPVPAGQRVKLTFEYSGPLANEENSPVSGMRLASINRDSAYLLLPARWFPLTDFPANRFTGVFHIEVPQNFVVAGTGTAAGPGPAQAFTTQVPAANPAETGAPVLAPRNRVPAKKAPAPLSQPAPQPSAPAASPVGAAASGSHSVHFPGRPARSGGHVCRGSAATGAGESGGAQRRRLYRARLSRERGSLWRRNRAHHHHTFRPVWPAAATKSDRRATARWIASHVRRARVCCS